MEKYFRIIISKNRLSAKLELTGILGTEDTLSFDELSTFLKEEKVTFGIKENVLREICANPNSINYPIVVAEGAAQKDGVDAYLLSEVRTEENEKREKFNFRNVLKIPSVKSGQLLATIIPPTPGTNGTDVSGRTLQAKNGKPLKIRPGKNVLLNGTNYYSTSDGELSLTNRLISVNPVFEVNGDLDLKTGNIDFIGNVTVRGNVPSGYEIKAGGDIKIFGLVEGAAIYAEGNIIISGGVTGGNKGIVKASGTIQATYLNQAIVEAGQDVIIGTSILHSKVLAGGSLQCDRALVIGGTIVSKGDFHIKEVGNRLFTKTEIRAGVDTAFNEKEQELSKQKSALNESVNKLTGIEQKLLLVEKTVGKLSEEQKTIIIKQRATKNHILEQLRSIDEEIGLLEVERRSKQNSSIYIYGTIYPNSTLHFGKYAKLVQVKHSNVRFYFSDGEIVFEPNV